MMKNFATLKLTSDDLSILIDPLCKLMLINLEDPNLAMRYLTVEDFDFFAKVAGGVSAEKAVLICGVLETYMLRKPC